MHLWFAGFHHLRHDGRGGDADQTEDLGETQRSPGEPECSGVIAVAVILQSVIIYTFSLVPSVSSVISRIE